MLRLRMKIPQAIGEWLMLDDYGSSSLFLASCILGAKNTEVRPAHPCDPSDFGRCLRLVRFLYKRTDFDGIDMRRWSKQWAAIEENWFELVWLCDEEEPTGEGPRLYKRMKELGL